MASSNLQGLNLIQPESPPSNLTDAQDLLSTPLFPDLAAQLDLWTHVNFASDEPFISARDRQIKETETDKPLADSLTRKDVHHFTAPASSPTSSNAQQQQFDFQRFLAEFGIPPSNVDTINLQNALAQSNFATTPNSFSAIPLAPASASPAAIQPAQSETTSAPAPKRARTSTAKAATSPAPSRATSIHPDSSEPNTTTPLNAAEDKRRRNTAASARFRLKKKEREAALDAKANSLEERVASLERECEGLRRENGWLRGLVVGVTGGVVPSMGDLPIAPLASASTEKRKRDEESA
ncbi:basic region leucine zipper protein [Rhizoctonia solani AG-3 Rhs1AP]|uniref:Basic region leucine zipper protein n=1 Tax=Rhizoctonia solani AG-3 Rhs1AP TaxID=1086054 RepID=X8JJH4_9AGAM|nr:basic region leucine zipper protein [Rhizoctonia solani AG-3 Rhs1AP]